MIIKFQLEIKPSAKPQQKRKPATAKPKQEQKPVIANIINIITKKK